MLKYYGLLQATMFIHDFIAKLKRLNPRLRVDTENAQKIGEYRLAGIYLKNVRQKGLSVDVQGRGHHKVDRYYQELETGNLDKYLGPVALDHIPEYDVFNAEYSNMAVPGWRTIVLRLVQQKVCSLERARKVFNCAGLGDSDYDRMSFFKKMQYAKKLDEGH